MNIFKKAIKEAKDLDAALTECKTPKFRKSTPPPKPNPNYTPPPTVKILCIYETPCGWCTKWDKKCNKKIGCDTTSNTKEFGKHTRAELVAMDELLDRYHKLFGIDKFTYKENDE